MKTMKHEMVILYNIYAEFLRKYKNKWSDDTTIWKQMLLMQELTI